METGIETGIQRYTELRQAAHHHGRSGVTPRPEGGRTISGKSLKIPNRLSQEVHLLSFVEMPKPVGVLGKLVLRVVMARFSPLGIESINWMDMQLRILSLVQEKLKDAFGVRLTEASGCQCLHKKSTCIAEVAQDAYQERDTKVLLTDPAEDVAGRANRGSIRKAKCATY